MQRQTVAEILVIWSMVAKFIILCVQICGSTVLTPVCQHWLEATTAFFESSLLALYMVEFCDE